MKILKNILTKPNKNFPNDAVIVDLLNDLKNIIIHHWKFNKNNVP